MVDSDIPHFNFEEFQFSKLEAYAKKNGFIISREGEDYYREHKEGDPQDGDCNCGVFFTSIKSQKDSIYYDDVSEEKVHFFDAIIRSKSYSVMGLRVGMTLSEIPWLKSHIPNLADITYFIIDSQKLSEKELWRNKDFALFVPKYNCRIIVEIKEEKIESLHFRNF